MHEYNCLNQYLLVNRFLTYVFNLKDMLPFKMSILFFLVGLVNIKLFETIKYILCTNFLFIIRVSNITLNFTNNNQHYTNVESKEKLQNSGLKYLTCPK